MGNCLTCFKEPTQTALDDNPLNCHKEGKKLYYNCYNIFWNICEEFPCIKGNLCILVIHNFFAHFNLKLLSNYNKFLSADLIVLLANHNINIPIVYHKLFCDLLIFILSKDLSNSMSFHYIKHCSI